MAETSRLSISSPAFKPLERIPERYTFQGANVSPPLRWSGAPRDTVELALICEDPDAPLPRPFVHWIIYGLPATVSALPEGLPGKDMIELPVLARQGKNSMQQIGYTGPNPPFWNGNHHYVFKLFALNKPIELWPGAGREDFYKALEGHVIAETRFVGLFQKTAGQRMRAVATWLGAGAAAFGAWKAISIGRRKLAP